MRTAARAGVVAVGVALLAAGCGKTAESGAHVTFVARGNAVCADFRQRFARIPPAMTVGETARYAPRALALAKAEVKALAAIPAPPEDRKTMAAYIVHLRKLVVAFAELIPPARRDDIAGLNAIRKRTVPTATEAEQLAKKIGLTACASK